MIPSDNSDDLRQAEQELRERERQLDSLMGHLPGLAYRALADEHWTCLFVSKGIEAVTGYTPDDFTSRRLNYVDIMLPEDRQATREAILTALRERGAYEDEHRIRHKDGSVRWIWARGHGGFAPDGSLRFLEGLNLDISARKQAEEALWASERRFRVFVEHAADAFFMTDEQGRVLDVNGRACEARGYTRDELLAMPPYEFEADFNPTVVEERVRRLLAGETLVFEDRYRRKDGTVFQVEVRGKAFWEGDRAFIVYLPRDVTDRKRAEAALRESEERFRTLAKATNDAVWDWDLNTNKVWWNEGVLTLFGYQLQNNETDPAWWLERIHPDDRAAIEAFFFDVVRGTELTWIDEYRFRCADGSYKDVYDRGYVIRDADGRATRMIGAMLDMTDRKRAEEALAERARLAALAADVGVALTGADTLRGILQPCAEALVRHLSAAFARVWTLNEAENVLEMQASAGMYTHTDGPHGRVPVGRLKIGLIAQQRCPVLTN